MTTPAWLFSAPIYEVSALPSHAQTPPSGTFLLCGTTNILTWLQQSVVAGARYFEVRLLPSNPIGVAVHISLTKANVASLVERKTRFAVLFRNNDRSSKHFIAKLMNVIEPLPQTARKSITFERGIEFSGWRKLKPGIGTEAWFCDPQAPWQKGSVENLNKRARRNLPRDTPIAALSNRDMKSICDRLNGTPRKCLGWRTPTEAFDEELRKLG